MIWSLYVDGELYSKTCSLTKALTMANSLEHTGYVLINATETSYHEYMWEFRLA